MSFVFRLICFCMQAAASCICCFAVIICFLSDYISAKILILLSKMPEPAISFTIATIFSVRMGQDLPHRRNANVIFNGQLLLQSKNSMALFVPMTKFQQHSNFSHSLVIWIPNHTMTPPSGQVPHERTTGKSGRLTMSSSKKIRKILRKTA